jgi:hypothetical protein
MILSTSSIVTAYTHPVDYISVYCPYSNELSDLDKSSRYRSHSYMLSILKIIFSTGVFRRTHLNFVKVGTSHITMRAQIISKTRKEHYL